MPETGTRGPIRVRDGITLRRMGDFLPGGSCLAEISGGGIRLTARVIEYTVTVAGRDAPELFCLITGLHDHQAHPAQALASACHRRWTGGNLPEGSPVRHHRGRAVPGRCGDRSRRPWSPRSTPPG